MNIQFTRNECIPKGTPYGRASKTGFVLPLVIITMVILIALAVGEMMASYNSRILAVQTKAQTEAMLAAEAGYERAIFWMSQQPDILGALQDGTSGSSGNIDFGSGNCRYQVSFLDFVGARPVFRVACIGISGKPAFGRSVDVAVMQETTGWAMGVCMVPKGTSSMDPVYFVNGEVIDTPIHINNRNDNPDKIDIHITGSPRFLQKVEMGESRKAGGNDKYKNSMSCFEKGVYFDQPYIRIADEAAALSKLNRFGNSTAAAYRFDNTNKPVASSSVSGSKYAAVQLEFFVDGGVGKVRITNNCTVKADTANDHDYKIVPGSGGSTFEKYPIYAYHYRPNSETQTTVSIQNTYVTQKFGAYESEPGGQIYVDGCVVIGGDSATSPDMVVKGKLTVVATGYIWVADSIKVDGTHDANGMPTSDNPNVLGLIARGVVKVVNPTSSSISNPSGLTYQPIGITQTGYTGRFLPDPLVVEAAITVGGGGWGAEDVGDRREYSGSQDDLIVRGSIAEAIRGVVGLSGTDGYMKNYYIDTRLMNGILPGDIWFSGKYLPAPAGWSDSRQGVD